MMRLIARLMARLRPPPTPGPALEMPAGLLPVFFYPTLGPPTTPMPHVPKPTGSAWLVLVSRR